MTRVAAVGRGAGLMVLVAVLLPGQGPAAGAYRGDGVGELAAVGVPLPRILGHRDLDEFAHAGRQIAGQRRGLADVLHRDGDRTVTEERPASGQRLVTDHAEGIHVRGGGRLIAGGLFRRDVLGGAHHHAGLGDGGGVDGPAMQLGS